MWLYLGIVSAVFLGLYDITRKHALQNNAVIPVLFFAVLAEAILLLPVAVLSPYAPHLMERLGLFIPQFGLTAHLLFALKSLMVAVLWLLAYFSIKHLPISIYSPIGASGPAWTLIGAIIIFGERLTLIQWVAFGVLFVSYYVFSIVGSREGIIFHTNKWVIFLFIAVLIGAASALLDKFLIQRLGYAAVAVQVWFILYMVPVLGFTVLFFWWPVRSKYTSFEWRWFIPMIGILLAMADVAYFKAIACSGTLISLLTAVRSASAVVSFLAGAVMFSEVRMVQKSFALAGVLLGVFLLFLS